ncbi:hypothetical protein [Haloferula sp. BvORR071]|uniref:hypothetical protein n=1 Tax=Haloferula sp. BvORR071 TaxID=1396141 RepID=UPI0005522447|nr:hypothetical protein [Haloferula sp. BvORR071]
MSCLAGIFILLYTLANIKSGRADLLALITLKGRPSDAEVTREDSGCLFWFVILFQLILGIGVITVGAKLERGMGIGPLWSM